MGNKLVRVSMTFHDGSEVAATRRIGFDSAFQAAQVISNAKNEMESMRVAFVHEIIDSDKKH